MEIIDSIFSFNFECVCVCVCVCVCARARARACQTFGSSFNIELILNKDNYLVDLMINP